MSHLHNNTYNKIADYLYVGSSSALTYLEDEDIQMVVNCTHNISFPENFNNCYRIPINDNPDESAKFLELLFETHILQIIHDNIYNKKKVLVHCSAGMQRSCSLIACYLIKYYGLRPNEAISYIIEKRPVAFFGDVNFFEAIRDFYVHQLNEFNYK